MNDPRKKWFRLAALSFFPLIFLLAEGALRVRRAMKPAPPAVVSVHTEPDPRLGYRLKKGMSSRNGGNYVNADGLRGDDSHLAVSPGSPRILVVGNSCVFGMGAPDSAVFEVVLERRLRASGYDSAIVFNAGVGGYNSNQCREYLERDLWKFKPDLVILYLGWNDMVTATWPFYLPGLQLGPELYRPSTGFWPSLLKFLNQSLVFWHAKARVEAWMIRYGRADRGIDAWNEEWIGNFRTNMDSMVRAAEQRGVKIRLCLLPYDHGRYPKYYADNAFHYTSEGYRKLVNRFQEEIRGASRERPVIDLSQAIAGVEHDTDVIYDYNHLAPEGHRRVAETMLEAVACAINAADSKSKNCP
ncbi:MAG: SGNH/GDSL hydrolase family protein [Candidatus Hydrogenedentota bacterium]